MVGYNHILIWLLTKKKAKYNFEKDFFNLMKNAVCRKTMEIMWKQK